MPLGAIRHCACAVRRGALCSRGSSAAAGGSPAQAIVWPISCSIAATDLPSAGATMVIAVPVRAGAAGAADAVDIVVGVVRHVEIEDVADVGNVEPARGDVGGDQELDLAAAERVERRRARRLVEVAMQRDGVEAVADQRAVQLRDLALAVAEDDGVLEVRRRRGSGGAACRACRAARGRS